MKLIVGLGNPGEKYKNTRHNIGFIFIDEIITKLNIKENVRNDFNSEYIKTENAFFQKPLTYMNDSGLAISMIMKYYKIDSSNLYVIYDDMDLELGRIRIREQGSAGGHNGIKSIIKHCGDKFTRIKIGIGNKKENAISHVLGIFSKQEQEVLDSKKEIIVNLITDILEDMSTEKLMNKYNNK